MIDRLPLLMFFALYLPSCYVGAMLLLLPGMWVHPHLPDLTPRVMLVVLVLLHVAPALLWVAAEGAFRWVAGRWPRRQQVPTSDRAAPLLAWLVFLGVLAVAGWSLHRAEGVTAFGAWFSHQTYLMARWQLMTRLTFLEFVNLYTVLPLAGAYVMLVQKRWWATMGVAALVGLAQYPLAQRRVLLASALLMGATLFMHAFVSQEASRPARRRPGRALLGGVVALYAFFLILSFQWGQQPSVATRGLVWRYGVPAILYPLVVPRIIPFYHVDLGLDMLGIGRMPDDNIQIEQVWAPGTRNTIAAPFQFVLYTQGGLLVALAGSVVVGALLGGCWAAVLGRSRRTEIRSLLGALVITFGAFLAMDSVRNALSVSYGLAWGGLVVGFLHAASLAWRMVVDVGTRPSAGPKGAQ